MPILIENWNFSFWILQLFSHSHVTSLINNEVPWYSYSNANKNCSREELIHNKKEDVKSTSHVVRQSSLCCVTHLLLLILVSQEQYRLLETESTIASVNWHFVATAQSVLEQCILKFQSLAPTQKNAAIVLPMNCTHVS